MKTCSQAMFLAGLISLARVSPLSAQPYNFDENGNGTVLAGFEPLATSLFSELTADPSGAITNAPVLNYDIGAGDYAIAPGDVALMLPGQTNIVKLLRFFESGGDSLLIFYAQADGTLAGVGLPTPVNPVQITVTNNLTVYTPAANQPGALLGGILPEYISAQDFEYYIHTENHTEPVYLSGTNLIWNYASPFSYAHFYVLAATNLSLPLTNWSRIATNEFDRTGSCSLTLPVTVAHVPCFYRIEALSLP